MAVLFEILEWLTVLTLLAFFGVIGYLAVSALRFKNAAVGHAKRLYERPVNSAKTLAATAKGIAQQEKVRVQHMAGTIKTTAGDVKETATEVKSAAQSVRLEEIKAALANAQRVFSVLSAAMQLLRATPRQGAHPHEA